MWRRTLESASPGANFRIGLANVKVMNYEEIVNWKVYASDETIKELDVVHDWYSNCWNAACADVFGRSASGKEKSQHLHSYNTSWLLCNVR